MNYFIISQDKEIENFIRPIDITKVINKDMLKEENIYKLDELPIATNLKSNDKGQYIDFIDSPIPIVSDELKKLLYMYDKNIFFKPIVFNDLEKVKQDLYWIIVPETLKCLSRKSEFNKNGTIKKLIINQRKAFPYKIFRIGDIMEDLIVITLDVAESILRREFSGIKFIKLEREV